MTQFRDALLNFVDTPPGNVHKSSSLVPAPQPKSDSPSGATGAGAGAGVQSVQIQGGGTYFSVLSNPA